MVFNCLKQEQKKGNNTHTWIIATYFHVFTCVIFASKVNFLPFFSSPPPLDQCPCDHHGCRVGVCNPAKYHRKTAVWPGEQKKYCEDRNLARRSVGAWEVDTLFPVFLCCQSPPPSTGIFGAFRKSLVSARIIRNEIKNAPYNSLLNRQKINMISLRSNSRLPSLLNVSATYHRSQICTSQTSKKKRYLKEE